MTTYSALKTRAATRFRDTNNDVITAAEWGDYLNDAYRAVLSSHPDVPWLQQVTTSLIVTAGTNSVALPTDCVQVNSVMVLTGQGAGTPLSPVSNPEGHLFTYTPTTDTGLLDVYRLRGAVLEVYPAPDVDTTLRVEYIAPPALLSGANDEPAFPEQFHHILIEGALGLAYTDDGNVQHAGAHEAKFRAGIEEMYRFVTMIHASKHAEIRDTFYDTV